MRDPNTDDKEGIVNVRSCTDPTPTPSPYQCTEQQDGIVGDNIGNMFGNFLFLATRAPGEVESSNYQQHAQIYAYYKDNNMWYSKVDGVSNNDGAGRKLEFSKAKQNCVQKLEAQNDAKIKAVALQ